MAIYTRPANGKGKEGSPSCGSGYTYDGTFTSTRVPGHHGVTAALLRDNGIRVFSETQLAEAEECLRQFGSK